MGFIQRQYSRRVSSSLGLSRTSRSRPPLPWDMNDHAFAVDVADLQVAQFCAAHAGRVQRHQHGAVHQVLVAESISRATSSGLSTVGSRLLTLGKRDVIGQVGSSECLDEEKTQSAVRPSIVPGRELAVAKQVSLVLANMVWTELSGERWKYLANSSMAWM